EVDHLERRHLERIFQRRVELFALGNELRRRPGTRRRHDRQEHQDGRDAGENGRLFGFALHEPLPWADIRRVNMYSPMISAGIGDRNTARFRMFFLMELTDCFIVLLLRSMAAFFFSSTSRREAWRRLFSTSSRFRTCISFCRSSKSVRSRTALTFA